MCVNHDYEQLYLLMYVHCIYVYLSMPDLGHWCKPSKCRFVKQVVKNVSSSYTCIELEHVSISMYTSIFVGVNPVSML